MLTPNYLRNIPNGVINIMQDIELEMLASLGKRMSKFGKVTGSMEWQIYKAQQLGIVRDDLTKAIAKNSNKTLMEVQRAFNDAGITSIKYLDNLKKMAVQQGLERVSKYGMTDSMVNTLQAGADRAINILNMTNTSCVQSTIQSYAHILDKAYLSISTGVMDHTSAIRQAMNDIVKQGIHVVEYTKSGKPIKYSVEASTRRSILTSVNQTTMRVQKEYYDTLEGCNLVETSAHAGARPEHAVWQGKVFYWGKPVKGYENFEVACGYGEVDGIGGINCYHSFFPYYEGISQQSFERDPSAQLGIDNDKHYELQQQQRFLERKVREAKKELVVYENAGKGFEKDVERCKSKISEAQYNVREFIKANDKYLARDYSREAVAKITKTPATNPRTVSVTIKQPKNVTKDTNKNAFVATDTKSKFNASNILEAENQAKSQKLANIVNYDKCTNINNLNHVNQTIYDVENKYKYLYKDGYKRITSDITKNNVNASADLYTINFNPKYLNLNKPSYKPYSPESYQHLADLYKRSLSFHPANSSEYKSIQKTIKNIEMYAKCTRYTVSQSYDNIFDCIKSTIYHEYGHTLSDRVFGMINGNITNGYLTDVEAKRRKQLIINTFVKAKGNGDISKISAYAVTDSHEFFAEVFSMREMKEKLPDYIMKMLEEVLR